MKSVLRWTALCALTSACSAPIANPERTELAPVNAVAPQGAAQPSSAPRSEPSARAEAQVSSQPAATIPAQPVPAEAAQATPRDGARSDGAAFPGTNAQDTRSPGASGQSASNQGAAPKASDAEIVKLPVAFVDGRALDVRRFLARVWLRDSTFAREVLDQLVVAELAIREADRLGIRVEPARVDEGVRRALDSATRRLADKGSKLSLEEHVTKNLGVDFALYRAELERDSLMQLLAERAVRAFALASERAVVRLAEFPDRAALDAFQAELAAGGDFAELVAKHGTEEIKKSPDSRMTLFQNENSKLSRLVFATPVGTVGGPLEEGGRFLLARVEERLAPKTGAWAEVGPLVEASLASQPVDDLEYAQWKTWVGKVYDVDLAPFLDLVGEKHR